MTNPTKAARTNRPTVNALRSPHVAAAKVSELAGTQASKTLYEAFGAFNDYFFGGKLAPGLVLITQTSNPRALGDYIERDVQGLESRIRIAPHTVSKGEAFTLDVVLHEMIHAWQIEIDRNGENGYRGHGPRFAAKCNEIGAKLGLPPVGVKGRNGLPDCAHWPLNVRPAGYYGDSEYVEPTRKKAPKAPKAPAPERDTHAERQAQLARIMTDFVSGLPEMHSQGLATVAQMIMRELDRRHGEGELSQAAE